MPFNHDSLVCPPAIDTSASNKPRRSGLTPLSTKDSCFCGSHVSYMVGNSKCYNIGISRDRRSFLESSVDSLGHHFVVNRTKICRSCAGCTGFGHGCVILRREILEPGDDCKCGVGDSGCINCGYCRTCAKNEECVHISDFVSDTESIQSEETTIISTKEVSSMGRLDIGTKVLSQWKHLGGAKYPGHISQVNDDGTYNVFYDDGDRDERVSLARITVIDSSKPKSTSITSEALPKISQSSSTRSNTHSSTSTETSTSQGVVRLLASMMASARDSSEGTRGHSTSTNTDPASGLGMSHNGCLVCRCGHNLGTLSAPLNPSYYHLTGRCTWNCCEATWESNTCKLSNTKHAGGRSASYETRENIKNTISSSIIHSTSASKQSTAVVPSMSSKEALDMLVRQPMNFFPCDSWKDALTYHNPIREKSNNTFHQGKKKLIVTHQYPTPKDVDYANLSLHIPEAKPDSYALSRSSTFTSSPSIRSEETDRYENDSSCYDAIDDEKSYCPPIWSHAEHTISSSPTMKAKVTKSYNNMNLVENIYDDSKLTDYDSSNEEFELSDDRGNSYVKYPLMTSDTFMNEGRDITVSMILNGIERPSACTSVMH